MEALLLKLVNMSITAGWLVLAVVVLRFLLKKAPKAIICALWALVAVRLIFPFSIESMFSLIPDPEPIAQQTAYAPVVYGDVPVMPQVEAVVPEQQELTAQQKLLSAAPVIWIIGMGVMVGYALISCLLLLRRTREGVEREKGVWLCDRIESPFILGIFRPRIFLPSSIDRADAEFVLAHERAHLKRLDHLWKPLGFLLLTVYWFNPLLWLGYILLCRDIELACDEKVLRQLGTEVKQDYSTALINCSVPRRMIAACPLAFGEVGVKNRIKSILNYKKPAFWIIIVALIAAAAVAVCFLTDPEKQQEEQGVTLELVSQQKDSLTVEWVNNTDAHIVIGYDTIYYKEDGKWVSLFDSLELVLGQHMWNRSLAPQESYQQIVYHYFIGITEPGEYRLDMKYVNPEGKEQRLSLEFTVSQVAELGESYTGPVWTTKLRCEESPDILKPTILLSSDGQFQFQYAGLSSHIAWGTYEENSQELVLTDEETKSVYRFEKDGWMQYRFDAENSTPLPQYKYDGVAQSPVPDGGLFEPYSLDGRIVAAASLPAYVDSDDTAEYWTVTYQPGYGAYVFEITASDPDGYVLYRDIFQYDFTVLRIHKDIDGKLQLLATRYADDPDEPAQTDIFDISVENGHIVLSSEQEKLIHLDYGAIS